MTALEQIEQLRQEMVKKVVELTGLPIDEIEVAVTFHTQTDESPLALEAKQLNWHPIQHQGSAWYTSEKPNGGATIVFVGE